MDAVRTGAVFSLLQGAFYQVRSGVLRAAVRASPPRLTRWRIADWQHDVGQEDAG
jgi:hypothetical protein